MRRDTDEKTVLRLRSPEDILAQIPSLLGIHPLQSLVILAFESTAPRSRVVVTGRIDLPPPEAPREDMVECATLVAKRLRQAEVRAAVLVAYVMEAHPPDDFIEVTAERLHTEGIQVREVLVTDGQRWRSLTCTDPECCPVDGRLYDLTTHPMTASAVFEGQAPFANEDELRASIAPVDDPVVVPLMVEVTEEVSEEFGRRYTRGAAVSSPHQLHGSALDRFVHDGLQYVTDLIRGYLVEARELTREEVAWTALYIQNVAVRDEAWALMTRAKASRHVEFWRQVARLARPPQDLPAIGLLAFAAWLSGNGILARVTVDRALEIDPGYVLAKLVQGAIIAMMSPDCWRPHPRALDAGRREPGDFPRTRSS